MNSGFLLLENIGKVAKLINFLADFERYGNQILQKTPNTATIYPGNLKFIECLCIFLLDFSKCKRYTGFER